VGLWSPPKVKAATIRKRSLTIAGHRTSVSLEATFWEALKRIATAEGCSLAGLAARVDRERGAANLSSALRVFVLERHMGGCGARPPAPPAPAESEE